MSGELLEQLRVMLDRAHVEDAEVPSEWASVTCQNIGHEQKPEQRGDDGRREWRCPDCHSMWWAVNGEESPANYHMEAQLYSLLHPQSEEQIVTQEWSTATMGPVTDLGDLLEEARTLKAAVQEAVEAAEVEDTDRCVSACERLKALAWRDR